MAKQTIELAESDIVSMVRKTINEMKESGNPMRQLYADRIAENFPYDEAECNGDCCTVSLVGLRGRGPEMNGMLPFYYGGAEYTCKSVSVCGDTVSVTLAANRGKTFEVNVLDDNLDIESVEQLADML